MDEGVRMRQEAAAEHAPTSGGVLGHWEGALSLEFGFIMCKLSGEIIKLWLCL